MVAYPVILILLCCIDGTINKLEIVGCTLKLSFHRYFNLYLVTEFTILDS